MASVCVARSLPPEPRGDFAFVMVASALIGQLLERGGEYAAMQFRGRNPTQTPLSQPGLWSASLGAGAITALTVYIGTHYIYLALIVALSASLLVITKCLIGVLTQDGDAWGVLVVRSLPAVTLMTMSIILLFRSAGSVFVVMTAVLAGQAAGLCFAVVKERRVAQLHTEVSAASQEEPPRPWFTHAGNMGIYTLYRSDQLILGLMTLSHDLGQYAVAVNVAEITQYIASVGTSILVAEGRSRLYRVWLVTMGATLAIAILLVLISPTLIEIFYGEEYGEASRFLPPLLAGSIFFAAARLFWGELLSAGRYKMFAATSLGVAGLATPGYLLAIQKWGAVGAANASCLAYAALAVLLGVAARTGPHGTPTEIKLPYSAPDASTLGSRD